MYRTHTFGLGSISGLQSTARICPPPLRTYTRALSLLPSLVSPFWSRELSISLWLPLWDGVSARGATVPEQDTRCRRDFAPVALKAGPVPPVTDTPCIFTLAAAVTSTAALDDLHAPLYIEIELVNCPSEWRTNMQESPGIWYVALHGCAFEGFIVHLHFSFQ